MKSRGRREDEVSVTQFLSELDEDGMAAWLKRALGGKPAPLELAPGGYPAVELASVPRFLSGDVLARFRAALTLLLKDFSERPAAWKVPLADELVALASLLGTEGLPGREAWDLDLPLTLKPMVELKAAEFERLPLALRLNILALLGGGPFFLNGEFWRRVAARGAQYSAVTWRGLLRDDWEAACAVLPELPDDTETLEVLRCHALYVADRIKADETGRLRQQMEAALPMAKDAVKKLLAEEAGLQKASPGGAPEDTQMQDAAELCQLLGLDKLFRAIRYARQESGDPDNPEWREFARNVVRAQVAWVYNAKAGNAVLALLEEASDRSSTEAELPQRVPELSRKFGEVLRLVS